jgi:putative membrane protein
MRCIIYTDQSVIEGGVLMKAFKIAGKDIRELFTSRFKRVALIVVVLMPLLYSFLYLYAFWDPYSKLDKLPVAVVNQDQGSLKDGKKVNYGNDIVNNLKENTKVKWEFVDYNDAVEGLNGKKFYSIVIIPEDFSKKITDVNDGKNIDKASIIYIPNEKKNFLAAQISSRIVLELKDEIARSITKEGVKATFDGMYEIKDGFLDAKDGALKIYNGSEKLANGSKELSQNLKKAKDGALEIKNGMASLVDGLKKFEQGVSGKDERIGLLVKGTNDLAKGITEVRKGAQRVDEGLSALNSASSELEKVSGAIDAANKDLEGVLTAIEQSNLSESDKQKILHAYGIVNNIYKQDIGKKAESLKVASNAVKPLVLGLTKLENGANQISEGTLQLAKGIENKQEQASQGVSQLINGASRISQGIDELSAGMEKLYDGSAKLNDGLNRLTDGTEELKDGLQEGYDKINYKLKFSSDDMSKFMSEPVVLNERPKNHVPDYGTGFAPYFIPLSLWVGALIMFFIISEEVDEKLKGSSVSIVIGKFITLGLVGLLQALTSSFVLRNALHLQVKNVALFYGFNILLSFVFIAVIQSMIFIFGDAGRFLSLVLLMLQLTSCAGTFPMELVPNFFKAINPYLPMTYATSALREIISGIDYNILRYNVLILVGFMFAFLIISMILKSGTDKISKRIDRLKEVRRSKTA